MDKFLKMAFDLAKKADPFPNPKVGAVLVKEDKIIGKGYHKKAGEAHAEINAINDAIKNGWEVKDSTLYVTLEPCSHKAKRTPPCTEAINKFGIKKIIFAMKDPNPFVDCKKTLKNAQIIGPVAQKNGEKLNRKYLVNLKKPSFVVIKMAMSADGKTATINGDSKWITSEKSREFVHKMRSEFDAVMIGANTVIADNPKLTSRIRGGKNPYRIIIDGQLKISEKSDVFSNEAPTLVFTSEQSAIEKRNFFKNLIVCGSKKVELKKVIEILGAMGLKKILIEGGSGLNSQAIEEGIVNELYFFIAPKIIGGQNAKSVIGGNGISKMSEAKMLKIKKIKRIGSDILTIYQVIKN